MMGMKFWGPSKPTSMGSSSGASSSTTWVLVEVWVEDRSALDQGIPDHSFLLTNTIEQQEGRQHSRHRSTLQQA